ncbi:DUF5686 family protein [Flavobacterium cellulosilyticum]|uniref:Carboxypeptidase-like regulatory domain-containing protein n=1 Tax=Flavobacterium cellulosilyticum TaxID=2541731 RepID=A0A4R5C856_9FLAO|nr:DUF5686 family protein [Flavobacterium cellulosilyticum]TDD95958.1 carboxypeptidase-like regulatory domain-containing protein [Flavobacterium cellulosilyticum]
MFLLPISKNSFLFFIVAFVILDFFDYLYHFMMHKTPLFWKFHQVHHSDLDVDITTTVREHPGETFIRVSYSILIICLIGATPWVLIFKQFIQSSSNIISHSKTKLPKKLNNIISKFFVTPNTHHIHHHYQLPYTDSNFGDVLTIWDQLFSTFRHLKQSEIICGVDTNMVRKDNENFKKLILRPFQEKDKCSKHDVKPKVKILKVNGFIIGLLATSNIISSQTVVKGILTDEKNEPIVSANIVFLGSNESTLTDSTGKFILKSNSNFTTINVSYIGFENKVVPLKKLKTEDLKIALKKQTIILNEVAIKSRSKKKLKNKENPAYKILENIWKNKKKNGLQLATSYEYEKYTSIELGMDNLDTSFVKKMLKKDFDSFALKMKTDFNNKFFVPIELIENNKKIYGNNHLKKERIDIDGSRATGIKQQGKIFDRIANVFQEIDVYQNNITILNKNFVSPISSEGFGTYNYELSDSTFVGDKKYYSIRFYPRESRDFAFRGSFIVDSKNYALTKIEMQTPRKMNLNFVRNFEFTKTFTIQNDSIYLPLSNEYKADFTLLTKEENEKGIYVIKKEKFCNYILNAPKDVDFYDKQILQLTSKQFEKDSVYWKNKQDKETKDLYKVVNVIKDTKKIKAVIGTIYILSDGYVPLFKGLQTGNIWTTAASNQIEGLRLRLGFRTFISDEDLFRVEGFTAYGSKDKITKYGLEARYLITNTPRLTISAAFLKDNEQMGLTQFNGIHLLPEADKSSKALFNRGQNYFLSKIQKSMFRFDVEPAKNLHLGFTFTHNIIQSADPHQFSLDYLDVNSDQIKSATTNLKSDIYLTYTPGKETSGFGVDEKLGIKLHPIFMFNYERGYKNVFGGSFNYNRLQVLYNNPISLGKFGIFDATVGAGKTFEATPLSLLTTVSANQTYFLLPNTFALLDYYEFVADTYAEGHFEQHFNGLLLNRIPIIKKLNWRSLLTIRGVYGTISNGSIAINQSSIHYVAPTKLYYEYGFGFENIGYGNVRPFRLDFIWRSNFQNFNGPVNPGFGIRIGLKTSF